MSTPLRTGAVSYLNTRPLVHGLDARPDLFSLRFDVPSACARLLHEGEVALGLIPAIEYLHGDYRFVPDLAIGADGPVASVALFSSVPVDRIRRIALDTSSRTSVALTRILCHDRWSIRPDLHPHAPDLPAMLRAADAALVIGDNALYADHAALGVTKVDLADEWKALTGRPFVFAVWAGPTGPVTSAHVAALQEARDRGVAAIDAIAEAYGGRDTLRAATARDYLRHNLRYGLGPAELAGLQHFHARAAALGLVAGVRDLRGFE